MKEETKKRLEEAWNDIINQLIANLALAGFAQSLGLDFGFNANQMYHDAIEQLSTVIDEVVEEVKSTDGMKELLEMLDYLSQIGQFISNLQVWITTVDTSEMDMQEFRDLLEGFGEIIDDFHSRMESVDSYGTEDHIAGVEPNDPLDE